ncbi:MAG: hypothetical protein NTV34_00850, partial [Proteobacteria bacterium]|nr:hypothetical protein [Pseudomonadota bacterium]
MAVVGCKTSRSVDGSANLESKGDYTGPVLKLSQIVVHYPQFDPAEDQGNPRTVFPAAATSHSGFTTLVRGAKITVAEPCGGKIIVNQQTKEVGCNLGMGHFFVFANFEGDKVSLEPSSYDPVEGLPEYVQNLKFIPGAATLLAADTPSTFTLKVNTPK